MFRFGCAPAPESRFGTRGNQAQVAGAAATRYTKPILLMSSFTITSRTSSAVDILELNGELDAHTASHLEDALTSLIEDQRHNIVVNFSNLAYISSAGLGVFMAYIEDVRERGGDIKLTNMSDKVYNVFDLLGFPTLYDILPTEEEAIVMFTS